MTSSFTVMHAYTRRIYARNEAYNLSSCFMVHLPYDDACVHQTHTQNLLNIQAQGIATYQEATCLHWSGLMPF